MIQALIGPERTTRQRLHAMLTGSVYRIGRGADPLPVAASFDPADTHGSRSLLDWFERGVVDPGFRKDAVLLVDDWALCHELDPELPEVVRWIGAFGQVIITARTWDEVPARVRPLVRADFQDFLALQGIPGGLDGFDQQVAWRPRAEQYVVAIGSDEHGQPVRVDIKGAAFVGGVGPSGAVIAPDNTRAQGLRSLLLGQMVTHSPDAFQVLCVDFHGTGVFAGLDRAPHVLATFSGLAGTDRVQGEVARRQEVLHRARVKDIWDYRRVSAEPLPELVVCIDGVSDLLAAQPEFLDAIFLVARGGRSLGMHLLLSDNRPIENLGPYLSYRIEQRDEGWWLWTSAAERRFAMSPDLAELSQVLPYLMAQGEVPRFTQGTSPSVMTSGATASAPRTGSSG